MTLSIISPQTHFSPPLGGVGGGLLPLSLGEGLGERLSEGGSYSIAACAAANRAMGTRDGEQLT